MNIPAFVLAAAISLPLAGFAASGEAGQSAQPPERSTSRSQEGSRERSASPSALAQTIRAGIETSLTALGDHQDFPRAQRELQAAFDRAIAYTQGDHALIRDAAFALRFVSQLAAVDSEIRRPLFDLLRASDELARTLAFLVKPEDDPARVYRVLHRLHTANPRNVQAFPALAAAISVVHDVPIRAKAAPQDAPRTIDPVAIFDFYTRNAAQMTLSPRTAPAELLIHVVDVAAEVPELQWALARHGNDRMVHKRYSDLQYDTAHFKYNKPKKIAAHPYTLENLRRHGGVCEEQAYFAGHVAKAIGTPSIYISGRGPGLSHAWVGVYLQQGSNSSWYMEEGRHDEYKDLRGTVTDPQTQARIPDDQVALSARLARTSITDRHAAQAYVDAAHRIFAIATPPSATSGPLAGPTRAPFALAGDRPAWPPELEPPAGLKLPAPRAADDARALALLQTAANALPAMPAVWSTLADAARAGRLGRADRMRWFDALYSAVGADHPDFCFAVLSTMIASVEDPAEQASAWDWVMKRYHQRKDLCATALIARGQAWRAAGRHHEAYTSYMEAVTRYSNDAVEAVAALSHAESLLKEGGREGHTIEMYRTAFQRTRRPSGASPGFYRQSNFYRIGDRYATLLEGAGRASEAQRIRSQLKAGEEKE
jgi:tetratricopeptide (TPR) repeat protein